MGYNYLLRPQLDIQMHNTYFVVPPLLVTTLLFLPIATIITGVRVLGGAFRHFAPNTILVALGGFWMVIALLLAVSGILR